MNTTYESSQVDFCEINDNGEFYNTISSFMLSIAGLIGIYMRRDLYVYYTMLVFVGLGSALFHHYLSEVTHWIDIIFINIILLYYEFTIISYPYIYMVFISLAFLIISILLPVMHVFLLFFTGFLINDKISRYISNTGIYYYKYQVMKYSFALALLLWIVDFFGCSYITPYHTHWLFHIVMSLVSYLTIILL